MSMFNTGDILETIEMFTQDSLRLTRQDDRYITTTQTRVKIETAKSGGTSVNSGGFSHSSGKF